MKKVNDTLFYFSFTLLAITISTTAQGSEAMEAQKNSAGPQSVNSQPNLEKEEIAYVSEGLANKTSSGEMVNQPEYINPGISLNTGGRQAGDNLQDQSDTGEIAQENDDC